MYVKARQGYYLKERKEEIKLLLGRTSVEADSTSVKDIAHQPYPEEIVGHVKWIQALWRRSAVF